MLQIKSFSLKIHLFGYEFHPTITYKMNSEMYCTLSITPYDPNKTNQEINNEKPKFMSIAPQMICVPVAHSSMTPFI
jgi:hypothetical protein